MSLDNPLPATWQTVRIALDAMEITRRMLARTVSHPHPDCQELWKTVRRELRSGTVYGKHVHPAVPSSAGETSPEQLEQQLEQESLKTALFLLAKHGQKSQERQEVEGLLVLGLWATFERFLRKYFQEKGAVLKQACSNRILSEALYNYFSKNVERWEPREILEFLRDCVFTTEERRQMIIDASSILTYRNYVAHDNPKKVHSKHQAEEVYDILNDIINILLQY